MSFSIICLLVLIICGHALEVPIGKRVNDASSYFTEGNLAKNEGQLKESLSFFRAAVRLLPNSTDYLMMLGTVEFNLNLKDEALKRFLKVLNLKPSLPSAKRFVKMIQDERTKSSLSVCIDDSCSNNNDITVVNLPIIQFHVSVMECGTSCEFSSFADVANAPFVIRNVLSAVGGNIDAVSSDSLSQTFGQHSVDFYPQNMLVKKVYSSSLLEGLDYLSYPEGAYLSVDASEPGAYIQWNMNQTTWSSLLEHSALSGLPFVLTDSLEGVFQSLVDESADSVSELDLARMKHSLAVKTHWYMLLVGEEGSGMFRHQDTIPVGSWQIQMSGSKRWIICSPVVVESPSSSCVEVVAQPGDFVYYPPHFWHETLNLDTPSVSLSGTIVTDRSSTGPFATMLREECVHNTRGFALDQQMCTMVLSSK